MLISKLFSRLPSKHFDEQLCSWEVVDWDNFTAEFYHLKVENTFIFTISLTKYEGGEVWGVHFGVVGTPISYSISNLSLLRYLERYSYKSTEYRGKRHFRRRGHFGAK